jgi:hypothetical protein
MGFWSNTQDRLVVGRKVEEQLYSQALNELESGVRRDGLWAKALAASEGDDARAKAQYISLVVQALKDETHIEKRSLKEAATREAATRAKENHIPETPKPAQRARAKTSATEQEFTGANTFTRSRSRITGNEKPRVDVIGPLLLWFILFSAAIVVIAFFVGSS